VVLSLYWVRRYGLLGVAWGTTVLLLASKIVIQPWYALRLVRLGVWEYVRSGVLRPLAASGAVFLPCWKFLRPATNGGIRGLRSENVLSRCVSEFNRLDCGIGFIF